MMGETGLRIDRNPDFFALLKLRGDSQVFIALEEEKIIGSLCVSLEQVYLGGEVYPVYYIGDFKVAAEYRNNGIGLQLCNELANYLLQLGADLVFLNVAKGNDKPFSFFKGRPGIPDFENIGLFKIHQFPGKKRKPRLPGYKIENATATIEVIQFFNDFFFKYELGPVINSQKLQDTELFVIRNESKIIAVMCLADTMAVKQNVVIKISRKMQLLLGIINFSGSLLGISKMPQLNEPVRMLYIKYLAVNPAHHHLVKLLVNHARNIVFHRSYSFVSIGLHEKDPLQQCFAGLFKMTFNSVGMLVSVKANQHLIDKVKKGIPFEDYSLV